MIVFLDFHLVLFLLLQLNQLMLCKKYFPRILSDRLYFCMCVIFVCLFGVYMHAVIL